jgi:hypothetical protein
LSVEDGIASNGMGSDSHEPFRLCRLVENDRYEFRKTNRKPYDLVQKTILIRAKILAGAAIEIGLVAAT